MSPAAGGRAARDRPTQREVRGDPGHARPRALAPGITGTGYLTPQVPLFGAYLRFRRRSWPPAGELAAEEALEAVDEGLAAERAAGGLGGAESG